MGRDLIGRWCSRGALIAGMLLGVFLPLNGVVAQSLGIPLTPDLMQATFPGATRFSGPKGTPPVYEAYAPDATGQEALAGYLFLTSEWPPLERGYSGTIKTLVGLDLEGEITGARVVDYHESLMSSRGDFLRDGPFERQLAGKHFSDPFRMRLDVATVSGATISAGATVRGVRDAARRVAEAYLSKPQGNITTEEIDQLAWPELVMRGFGERLRGAEGELNMIEVFLIPVDEALGRKLLGSDVYDRGIRKLGPKAAGRPLWMVGLDGPMAGLFRASAFTIERATDTLKFASADVALTGEPHAGKVDIQYRNVGLIAMDPSLDPKDEFTFRLDFGGKFRPYTLYHPGDHPTLAVAPPAPPAAGPAVPPSNSDAAPSEPGTPDPAATTLAAGETAEAPAIVAAEPVAPAVGATTDAAPAIDNLQVDFTDESEATILRRTIEETSWVKFWLMAALLVVTTAAFFSKVTWLRWGALAGTIAVLGFGGGGFLSVSHITAAIKVGPTVFLQDLPLLLLVAFTVVTTLLWGRVFCGYLCPFGALQDFMEHIVPKRLRRKLPHPVHESGLYLKYGVLAGILVPAIAGSEQSIFQYFEPFGTVFFFSKSMLLWAIAGAILIASAIIPRFYCRYMCPLGASLALASLLTPFRIKRVQQCSVCTVCEHACPTGAIQRAHVDFKECVRCNICEVKLKETAGVCKHDLEQVSQLIQIKRGQHHLHQRFPTAEAVGGD